MVIKKVQNKKRKQNREKMSLAECCKKIFFWIAFLGFWVLAVWTLLFSDVMRVENIIVDSSRAEKEEVRKIVRSQIDGSYLGIIPKSNLLVTPDDKIKKKLKESFIFAKDVRMKKSFPKTVEISLEERDSHIVWCSNSFCYLVDENAEAFYVVDDPSAEYVENLVVVTDVSNKEVGIGSRVADPIFVEFCERLPGTIGGQTEIEIERNVSTPSSMSEEVRVTTTDGWKILLSTSRGIDSQVEIIKKLLREKIPPEKVSHIEYFDLRIKGKATFRYKESAESDEKKGDEDDSEKEM